MPKSFTRERPRERAPRRRAWLVAAVVGALSVFAGTAASVRASAEEHGAPFKIIVHPRNPAASAPRIFVANAFLKKTTRWADGELIRPVDLRPESAVRERFSRAILKRPVSAVRNYWQQRIFSGRDTPPPVMDSDEQVIEFVAKHAGAIGYISEHANVHGVKVLAVE